MTISGLDHGVDPRDLLKLYLSATSIKSVRLDACIQIIRASLSSVGCTLMQLRKRVRNLSGLHEAAD